MKTKILYLFFVILGIGIGMAESTNEELTSKDLNSRRDNPVTELVDYILSYNGQGNY